MGRGPDPEARQTAGRTAYLEGRGPIASQRHALARESPNAIASRWRVLYDEHIDCRPHGRPDKLRAAFEWTGAMAERPSLTTVTHTSLLKGLREPSNRTVWQQFDARYRPMIVSYARRRGLSDADADDAAQKTLLEFSESYRKGKYNRKMGRLHKWLFGIARNQIKNTIRRRPVHEHQIVGSPSQTDFFGRVGDEEQHAQLAAIEEQEWRKAILKQCLVEIRQRLDPKTVQAFDLFAGQGWSAQRVAKHLDMSENAVYLAKHKILKEIREIQPEMEETW